jgi:hypothetical protein
MDWSQSVKPIKFIVARLSEASTWKGVFLILTAAGVTLRPELQAAITAVGLSLTGLVGVVVPDAAPPAE